MMAHSSDEERGTMHGAASSEDESSSAMSKPGPRGPIKGKSRKKSRQNGNVRHQHNGLPVPTSRGYNGTLPPNPTGKDNTNSFDADLTAFFDPANIRVERGDDHSDDEPQSRSPVASHAPLSSSSSSSAAASTSFHGKHHHNHGEPGEWSPTASSSVGGDRRNASTGLPMEVYSDREDDADTSENDDSDHEKGRAAAAAEASNNGGAGAVQQKGFQHEHSDPHPAAEHHNPPHAHASGDTDDFSHSNNHAQPHARFLPLEAAKAALEADLKKIELAIGMPNIISSGDTSYNEEEDESDDLFAFTSQQKQQLQALVKNYRILSDKIANLHDDRDPYTKFEGDDNFDQNDQLALMKAAHAALKDPMGLRDENNPNITHLSHFQKLLTHKFGAMPPVIHRINNEEEGPTNGAEQPPNPYTSLTARGDAHYGWGAFYTILTLLTAAASALAVIFSQGFSLPAEQIVVPAVATKLGAGVVGGGLFGLFAYKAYTHFRGEVLPTAEKEGNAVFNQLDGDRNEETRQAVSTALRSRRG